jgi:hypothetical protein
MNSITRRKFFAGAGALTALAALPTSSVGDSAPGSEWAAGEVDSTLFRLSLSPREGLKNTRLLHVASGLILADADYSYSFGRPTFQESRMTKSDDGSVSIHLHGSAWEGNLEITQQFHLPAGKPWMEEEITLTNRGALPLDISRERCGFVLPLERQDAKVTGAWQDFKLTSIPYRRWPWNDRSKDFDFTLDQILDEEFRAKDLRYPNEALPGYPAEGWAWTDGKQGFLVTKYSQEGMEYSILDRVPLGKDHAGFRWGGLGTYLGEPQHGAWLRPGESHPFGVTRLTAYQGGMLEGFYTFRQEMAERGHGCPPGFNPPVHWNELYDNKLWWLPDDQQGDPANRKKYYQLADMKEAAAKAKAIGCEALYLDPGWDTLFGSKIWDESRLGPCKDFTAMLRRDYGLKLSLHTPMSGWCDAASYPSEAYRVDLMGERLTWRKGEEFDHSPLCGASNQYVEETVRRLKALARDGATFFMFDGDQYHAECWDPQHGHAVPARREEHTQALCRMARMVHEEYPQVLIEMHGPSPAYYGHGRASADRQDSQALGWDSAWAFELMWDPMGDLVAGRSSILYHYALAYGLPLYIHIDLRTDNAQALVFWWNASTCRHLGIGGTHKDPAVRKAHHEAMATYRKHDAFFKAGAFYGLDELDHLHVHPSQPAAVVNCFNLEERPVHRQLEIDPAKFGLNVNHPYEIKGATARREQNRYIVEVDIPSRGHVLVEMRPSAG